MENTFQLSPEHPWYWLSSVALPNVKWCEQPLNSWISEPANTWSNLAYIFVGLMIYWHERKSEDAIIHLFAPCAIILGISSFVYHMSYTFVLQVLDFYGMYIVFFLPLILNIRRFRSINTAQVIGFYLLASFLLTGLTIAFHIAGYKIQLIVVAIIIGIIITEIMARKAQKVAYSRFFYLGYGSLLVGGSFSASDVSRVFCNPNNHFIQGHAIWHVFSALCIYFIYRYYQQFSESHKIRK